MRVRRVGLRGRLRVMVALAMVATALAAPAAAAPSPFATATVAGDEVAGGSVFTVELWHMDLPPGDDFVEVYVSRNGIPVSDHPFGEAEYLPCPADTDPGNDPGITNSCSFFLHRALDAGDYDLDIYVGNPSIADSFAATATLATSVTRWWDDWTPTRVSSDLFTGAIDLTVRFDSVPASVGSLSLQTLTDSDRDGFPDRPGPTVACSATGVGVATCDTGTERLPSLCTEDSLGGQFCDDGEYRYAFEVNGIPIGLSVPAIHYRLSRYQEGQFFGRQAFDGGLPLSAGIDLDTFLYGSTDACNDTNLSFCFDRAFYRTWLDAYAAAFDTLMGSPGHFDVTVRGAVATVDAFVPRLPTGARGLRAVVAHWPVGDPGAAVETPLPCAPNACTPVVLTLPEGDHELEVRLYNDHPPVDVVDYVYDEYTWGGERFASYPLPGGPITIAGPTLYPGGAGVVEGDAGSRFVSVPVRLDRALAAPVTVDWTTVSGEAPVATEGSDFVPASGTVTIPAGATEGFAVVEVLGDTIDEPPVLWGEWGFVAFTDPTGPAEIWPGFHGLGIFAIVDDD